MTDPRTAPYAALVLRLTMGALFLAHAWLKIAVFTPAGTAKFFASVGLPPSLAYATIAAELGGGIALLLGLWTRAAAIALVPILIGAAVVHSPAGFFFNNPTGGWEYPAFWAVSLLVLALLGDGAFALVPTSLLF